MLPRNSIAETNVIWDLLSVKQFTWNSPFPVLSFFSSRLPWQETDEILLLRSKSLQKEKFEKGKNAFLSLHIMVKMPSDKGLSGSSGITRIQQETRLSISAQIFQGISGKYLIPLKVSI